MHTWVQTIALPAYTQSAQCAHQAAWWGIQSRPSSHTADCAKFFQWHILLPTVQQQCRLRAGEVMSRADGFPGRGRRLSFWQRTDLWIHNAYVNPQMVPRDTFSHVNVFSKTVHPSFNVLCLIILADKSLRKCVEKCLTVRIGGAFTGFSFCWEASQLSVYGFIRDQLIVQASQGFAWPFKHKTDYTK